MSSHLKKQLCFLNNLPFYLETTEESKMSYWDSVKDGGGLSYTHWLYKQCIIWGIMI